MLNEDTRALLDILIVGSLVSTVFLLMMNLPLWMPEWIAMPFFTSLTNALENAADRSAAPAPPPVIEYIEINTSETSRDTILTFNGTIMTGNVSHNFSITGAIKNVDGANNDTQTF